MIAATNGGLELLPGGTPSAQIGPFVHPIESPAMTQPPATPVPPRAETRIEDERFITGTGRYVDDLAIRGDVEGPVLHAAFARSTEAHAVVRGIDTSFAAEVPGVLHILIAADLPTPPIPGSNPFAAVEDMDRPTLATDRVRFAGEPVAMVIAESAAAAEDGASMVFADLDPLPVVSSIEEALRGDVVLHEAAGTNVVERWELAPEGAPPAVDVETTVEVVNGRVVPNSIEPLAILAVPTGDRLTVHISHQNPHRFRSGLAGYLGVDEDRLRILVPDVGGGFGMKGMLYPEYIVVCAAARQLGRPVQWLQRRREHFVTGTHGRGLRHRITLGGDAGGRVRTARIDIVGDAGAYPHNGSQIPTFSRYVATGLYDIEHVHITSTTVVTNLAPTGSYRGAGRPEAAFAIERAIEEFAVACRMDPAEVRRLNMVRTFPYRTATGAILDSGDYVAALDEALRLVDLDGLRTEQTDRRARGADPLGVGIGAFVERAGGAVTTGEFGEAELLPDGTLEVRTGSMSTGQGHETVFARVAATAFDLDASRVAVVAGDTDAVARGTGTNASRSTMLGASAVWRVSSTLASRVRDLAASMLEASPSDVVMTEEGPGIRGVPDAVVAWHDLVAEAGSRGEALVESEFYVSGAQTFPYGVHVAAVEVSLETGEVTIRRLVAVDDYGNVINPMIVEGQSHGSLAQGIGQALMERVVYSDNGQPLTASFMDYPIPAAAEMPEIVGGRLVNPAPSNPLGAKGAGEAGCIGAPPAIVNAVLDALRPHGVRDLEMPLTPGRVWQALRDAGV